MALPGHAVRRHGIAEVHACGFVPCGGIAGRRRSLVHSQQPAHGRQPPGEMQRGPDRCRKAFGAAKAWPIPPATSKRCAPGPAQHQACCLGIKTHAQSHPVMCGLRCGTSLQKALAVHDIVKAAPLSVCKTGPGHQASESGLPFAHRLPASPTLHLPPRQSCAGPWFGTRSKPEGPPPGRPRAFPLGQRTGESLPASASVACDPEHPPCVSRAPSSPHPS